MKHFEASKALAEAYKYRTLTQHAASGESRVFDLGDSQVVLVFDHALSRALLTSAAFAGFNYFREGVERSAMQGEDLRLIRDFYASAMLFKEGSEHHEQKRAFHRMLETLCTELESWRPRVLAYFAKRRNHVHSALDFSNALVRLVAGLMIARLAAQPLGRVWRALEKRRNVFYFFHHPSRQSATNEALRYLFGESPRPDPDSHEWHGRLLAESLIVMGVDPLIGGVCANLVDGQDRDFATGVFRYCPTSFVSRICVAPCELGGIAFMPGDVSYVALLPAADASAEACPAASTPAASLAFGVGVHACIGRHLSLVVMELAETVYREIFPAGFSQRTELSPDGAFLAFRRA